MIEIYNTIIDEREVIGVGPLYTKRSADQVMFQLYNERQFYFDVLTTRYHFTVTTDWLSFKEPHTESSKLAHDAIREAHMKLRRCLIDGNFSEMLIFKEHGE